MHHNHIMASEDIGECAAGLDFDSQAVQANTVSPTAFQQNISGEAAMFLQMCFPGDIPGGDEPRHSLHGRIKLGSCSGPRTLGGNFSLIFNAMKYWVKLK